MSAPRTVTTGQTPLTDTAIGQGMAECCATCDFRPQSRGNPASGQFADLVRECLADEGQLVCHETGQSARQPGAICAGFAAHPDAPRSLALRIATTGHAQRHTREAPRDREPRDDYARAVE